MEFYHEQMPHMHRHGGKFSLSQITMDDVDLPRRMKGGEYVHAYYAYDVVSQCRIGLAYGRDKDDALVVDCFVICSGSSNATDGVFQPVLRWSST